MLVSFIICTYNRSELLKECLLSLLNQNTEDKDFEIIVVNNNSNDDTDSIVQELCRFRHIGYIRELQQGLSYARNAGCDYANGIYLGYLDDDAKVPATFISTVISELRQHDPDIYGGPIHPYYKHNKPRWFKDSYEIREFSTESCFSFTCRVSGGNFFIKKEVLIRLGKFDVTLGMKGNQIGLGEERAVLELYRRHTAKDTQKVYYSLNACVLHYVPPEKMKRRYMIKRYFQAGRSNSRVKRKDPASAVQKTYRFIPDQVSFATDEISKSGLFKADYTKIMLNISLRYGNLVGLYDHGLRAVFRPHIKNSYLKFRILVKKTSLYRILLWIEKSIGIR